MQCSLSHSWCYTYKHTIIVRRLLLYISMGPHRHACTYTHTVLIKATGFIYRVCDQQQELTGSSPPPRVSVSILLALGSTLLMILYALFSERGSVDTSAPLSLSVGTWVRGVHIARVAKHQNWRILTRIKYWSKHTICKRYQRAIECMF